MKTYNTYYSDLTDFNDFIQKHHIRDNPKLLIQIFTAITHEKKISKLIYDITSIFPSAHIIGSTTDGEICSGRVSTGMTVISLSQFERTTLKVSFVDNCKQSYQTGQKLAQDLCQSSTKLIITFTDGLNCNGEDYLNGISSVSKDVIIAGGMAGDNAQFQKTFIFSKEQISTTGAVGVALINQDLYIHTSHSFNWLSIGKAMKITRVEKNRIYTIDHLPAYNIYKKYLGRDVAENLPAIGVEFPLIIQKEGHAIARAVLVKHDDGSLSFGGSFNLNDMVKFGYGDSEMILNHSIDSQYDIHNKAVESIFIYSCMARRRFMPNLIENEIRPFQQLADVAGFFTYSEFFSFQSKKELLNQTMTLLGISESKEIKKEKIHIKSKTNPLNEYQKSIKALSHLLNITTKEMADEYKSLEKKTAVIEAQKESLRVAQKVGHFGSWEIDLITKKAIWSEESYLIYKMDPKTTKPTLDTFISRVIEEDKHLVAENMQALLSGGVKSAQLRIKRDDDIIITVLINAKIIFNKTGQAVKMIGTTLDISEQIKLKKENDELATIIEYSSNEIYIVEKVSYNYIYVNKKALETLGYTREELYSMNLFDINKSFTFEKLKSIESTYKENPSLVNRTIHTKKDGTTYPVQSYIQYRTFNNKEVIVMLDVDISDLISAEQKQKRQAQILEQIHDSVISTDLNGIITHWNQGATIIHGYKEKEMIGKSIELLYLEKDLEKAQWMRQQALLYDVYHGQIRKKTKNGNIIYTDVSISVLKDDNGKVIGLTRYSQDTTHKKEIENKLKIQTKLLNFQAYHDPLTELPNRTLFDDRLQQSITNAQLHNEKFGLLFIDLDNFKQINDTLGHHYGDEILKIVAKRLSTCVRKEDTLSRLGGDEFTVLVQNLKTAESIAKIAQKIIESLKPKIVIETHELHITASIGISLYPKDSVLKNDLLKYADTAMYKAKDEGRNNYQFYSEEMTLLAFERAMMETNLRKAIKEKEFVVYYQPQIDARDNSIIGLEALVRWKHPEMGLIFPDKFISLAEDIGFIVELDHLVMKQAMIDISKWYKEGLTPGILSLNLSIKQLMDEAFIGHLNKTIKETNFNIEWLKFEITESQMMLDPMKSIGVLKQLHKLGIQIAIDDFGTGYSSLAYLKRLPVNTLKIDQSFIQDLPDDEEDRAISKAVIALAESLNLSIIAEGVENPRQVEYLLSNGCHYIQGYYYSKAITQKEMTQYIKNNKVIKKEF